MESKRFWVFVFCILFLSSFAVAGPTANAGSDQSANIYDTLSFSGAATACTGCSIVSYNWNFGDGIGGSGVSTTHSYNTSAAYTVTLVVVSNLGEISSDTLTATISSSDSIAPVITHTPTTAGTNNTAITIYATITDNVGVSSATLYYRRANETNYASTSMSGAGTTYSGTIPAAYVTMSNVAYYLEASDATPNTGCKPASSTPCNSSYYNITISESDTTPPTTSLTSVSVDTAAPYYDVSNDNKTTLLVSGESGMSCRYGTSDANYGNFSSSNTCVVVGTQTNCSLSLGQGNYTYYVSCKDGSNNSQNTSQNIDVTFFVDWTAPSDGSLSAAALVGGYINLSWTPANDSVSGLSIQKVYRNGTLKISLSASSTTWVDTSTTDGASYNYSICGTDAAGNIQSNTTCMSATATADASSPTISAIGPLTTQTSSSVTLSATTNENARCRYSNTSGYIYSNMSLNFSSTGGTLHSTTLTLSNGDYTYYVSCADTTGNSMNSSNSTSFSVSIPGPSGVSCTPTTTCTDWSACSSSGTQTRTCTSKSSSCATSSTTETQTCVYVAPTCTESWSCTGWSACSSSGTQTRTCTDANSCGTTINKPATTQTCTYTSPVENVTVPAINVTPIIGGINATILEIAPNVAADVAVIGRAAIETGVLNIKITTNSRVTDVSLNVKSITKPAEIVAPNATVHKYLEISAQNLVQTSVDRIIITFVVEKADVKNIANIKLVRYVNGAWTKLPTTYAGEEEGIYYKFVAETPGFSYFAIIEEEAVTPPAKPEENVTAPTEEAALKPTPQPSDSTILLIIVAVVAIGIYYYYTSQPKKRK